MSEQDLPTVRQKSPLLIGILWFILCLTHHHSSHLQVSLRIDYRFSGCGWDDLIQFFRIKVHASLLYVQYAGNR